MYQAPNGVAVSKAADPYGVTASLLNAQAAWMMHPQELMRAASALSGDLIALQAHLMRRAMGMPSADVIAPHADDVRFADPVWTQVATWDIIKEWYLAFTHRLQDMYFETPGLSDKERRRAAFWSRKWLNMVAPTNFFWLNPVAMERFVESNGESLQRGWENFQRDAKAKNILMVEPDAFELSRDQQCFELLDQVLVVRLEAGPGPPDLQDETLSLRLSARNLRSRLDQLDCGGQRGAARGFGEHPLGLGQEPDRREDRLVPRHLARGSVREVAEDREVDVRVEVAEGQHLEVLEEL